jgi:hypothetical protein
MADTEDWWAEYQRKEAERLQRSEQMVQYVMGALRFLGVKRVRVPFDGFGDDGEVQDPVYEPEPAGGLPEGLDYLIRDCCCNQLPGGWEINAGSVGAIEIDVENGTSQVNIEWREEEDEDLFDDEDEG